VLLGPLVYDGVPPLVGALLFVVRWSIAGVLLLLGVALVLRFAPEPEQPAKWVTRGTLLIVSGWVVMSIGFGVYLRDIASYGSIFGSLATVVVLGAYLYLSAIVFLGGVQVDALARST